MSLRTPPVDATAELFYSGVWNDISTYVYQRDAIQITRGIPDQSSSADPSNLNLTLDNRDGRFSTRNPNSPLYGLIGRNTPIRIRAGKNLTDNYGLCMIQDDLADFASTPDAAALDIVGDIDIRVEMTTMYTTTGGTQCLVSKGAVGSGQLAYQFLIGVTAGVPHLTMRWSTNGSAVSSVDHDIADVLTVGGHVAVRATLDVVNGANHVTTFYTSSDGTINGTWNVHGAVSTVAGATSIFSGSGALHVGEENGTDHFVGVIQAVRILNGIGGTAVANPDFNLQTRAATSFTDAAGRVWTTNNGEAFIGAYRFTRFVGEVSSWPQSWDITGTDIYAQITASGVSRRLGQGQQSSSDDPMLDYLASTTSARVWPGSTAEATTSSYPLAGVACATGVGLGDLGIGSTVMLLPTTNVTRDSNGYMQSGFVNAPIHAYDPDHFGMGLTFRSDLLGELDIVCNGYLAASRVSEWEVQLRGDGVNNDVRVINRTHPFAVNSTATQSVLADTGSLAALVDGNLHTLFFTLDRNVSAIDWDVSIDGVSVFGGVSTLASQAIGTALELHIAYNEQVGGSAVNLGYIGTWVGSNVPTAAAYTAAALRNAGETAADRISRLCTANGVHLSLTGSSSDTMLMGPQANGQLLDAMKEAADTDVGFLWDDEHRIGLRYRTRVSLYNQTPAAVLDYSAHVFSGSPDPTDDDLSVHNDVTTTNVGGATGRAILTAGALSIQAPPNGINTYSTSYPVSTDGDGPLDAIAAWVMNRATIDRARYPSLPLGILNPNLTTQLVNQILLLNVGDLMTLRNLPAWLPPDDVPVIAIGLAETISQVQWDLTFNCSQGDLYTVGVYGTARYDAETSTVGTLFNTSATSLSIASAAHTVLWTTSAGDFPFDIGIAGERMTVTNITGASSPQTFTVTRHVNGITKSHAVGEAVHLWAPSRYAL